MTESEALNMIQAKLTCMELYDLSCVEKGCDRKCDNCYYNYAQGNNGEQKEALKVAIQALEKQIPKKSITYKDTNRADCPCCGATVRGIKNPFGDWCSNCGQKLDFGE